MWGSNQKQNKNMKVIAGSKNRVLVKPIDFGEQKTASGLILTMNGEWEAPRGTVVEVSNQDEAGVASTVKKGDVVLYFKHGPTPVKIKNKDFLVMKEYDIYAID